MRRPFQKELIMMNGSRLPKPPRRPSHLSPFVDSMEGQVWCFKSPKKNAPKTHMFDTNKKTLTALWGGKSKYFWPISSGNQTWFAGKDPFSSMFCTFEAPLIGDFPGASWAGSCSCPCQVPLTCGGWGYMKHYEAATGEHGTMMTPDNSDRIYNDIHQFHHFFCKQFTTFHHISPHFTTFHHISLGKCPILCVKSYQLDRFFFRAGWTFSGRDPGVTRNGSSSARSCASSGDDFTMALEWWFYHILPLHFVAVRHIFSYFHWKRDMDEIIEINGALNLCSKFEEKWLFGPQKTPVQRQPGVRLKIWL